MTEKKVDITEYWFTIEPYVYVGLTNDHVLLFNTLDNAFIESGKSEIIELLQEMLQKENYGVILLSEQRFLNKNINNFIKEIRKKHMGDIINVSLSKGRPIQLLPFFNFSGFDKFDIYKRHNFSSDRNILEKLSEISIHIDRTTEIKNLLSFLQSVPNKIAFNIVGDIGSATGFKELLSFFDLHSSPKNILCSYTNIIPLQPAFENNFSYKVVIDFPIIFQSWNNSIQLLQNQTLPFEFIFNVSSLSDYQKAEQLIDQFHIERYQFNPVYTGNNIQFFEENVFLTKEDILSMPISIKNIFANQSINIYDFGKISIMPNGDVFSNINLPSLGNIYTNSLHDLIWKEIYEGKSWLRIRNQNPCNKCVYQWLCPPLSNYELIIGRPNLCHI